MTAGLLLAAHPELAERLVLVGALAMGVVPNRQFELKAWRYLIDLNEQLAIHRYNLGVLMLHDTRLIDGLALQTHVANVLRDRMPRRRLAHTDILARSLPRWLARCMPYMASTTRCTKAGSTSLKRPLLRLRLISRHAPVPNAGHWVQFEQPEVFDAALLAALA